MTHSVYFFYKLFQVGVSRAERKRYLWNAAEAVFPLHLKTEMRYDHIALTLAGKPYLPNSNLFFSFTDTPVNEKSVAAGLAITAGGEVGADSETLRNHTRALRTARYFFHPTEALNLERQENLSQSFFELWTRKEAYAKYNGTGLNKVILGTSFLSDRQTARFPVLDVHMQTLSFPVTDSDNGVRKLIVSVCMLDDFTLRGFHL